MAGFNGRFADKYLRKVMEGAGWPEEKKAVVDASQWPPFPPRLDDTSKLLTEPDQTIDLSNIPPIGNGETFTIPDDEE